MEVGEEMVVEVEEVGVVTEEVEVKVDMEEV